MNVRGRGVGGLKVVLYLVRPTAKRANRLAQGRLHRLGPVRGRTTLHFRPLTGKIERKAYLLACVVGAERHGLGRCDLLASRCGHASFRF